MSDHSLGSKNLGPQEKRELLQKLLAEKVAKGTAVHASHTSVIPRQSRGQEFFPLSPSQQRLLFLEQLEPNTPIYNNSVAYRLHGHLNVNALERSLDKIIQRHESLRTLFTIENGMGVQHILTDARFTLNRVDLEGVPETLREAEMLRLANEEVTRPI